MDEIKAILAGSRDPIVRRLCELVIFNRAQGILKDETDFMQRSLIMAARRETVFPDMGEVIMILQGLGADLAKRGETTDALRVAEALKILKATNASGGG